MRILGIAAHLAALHFWGSQAKSTRVLMRLSALCVVILVAESSCGKRENYVRPILTPENSLFAAACVGDVAAVERHLANGVNVDERCYPNAPPPFPEIHGGALTNPTPLQGAVEHGKKDIVRILLAHGAKVNARTGEILNKFYCDTGMTALELAAAQRTSGFAPASVDDINDIIAQILEQKPNPNSMELNGAEMLMGCIFRYATYLDTEPKLAPNELQLIASLLRLDIPASARTEALKYAAGLRSNDALLLFVEGGASDQQLDLALLASTSRPSSVRSLLQRGANPNVRDERNDKTPLFYAAANKNIESVRLLLEAGADPNAVTRDGKRPLDLERPSDLEAPDEIRSELTKHTQKTGG